MEILEIRARAKHVRSFYLATAPKVAVVALARKVLCILHHMIVNREMFEDETANKSKREKPGRSSSSPELVIEDAIQILVRAGYMVQKRSEREGG
jgi:transposase